jgi:hypothetical protein
MSIIKRIIIILKNVYTDPRPVLERAAKLMLAASHEIELQRRLVNVARVQREQAYAAFDDQAALVRQATALQFGEAVIWRDSAQHEVWNLYCMDDVNRNEKGMSFEDAVARAKEIASEPISIDDRPVPQGIVEEAVG